MSSDILQSLPPLIVICLFLGVMLWKLMKEKRIDSPNTLKFALILLSAALIMLAVFSPVAEKAQMAIILLAGTVLGYALGKPECEGKSNG